MPGRWSDEWRDRGQSSYDDWRDGEARRWSGREERSFARDRVFGERDTGVGYNQSRETFQREQQDLQRAYRGRGGDWQDRDYEGVSPAMRRGEYDTGYRANPRFQHQDYTRGARYYGDDVRASTNRESYGLSGHEYGAAPRGYEQGGYDQRRRARSPGYDYSEQFASPDADEGWRRAMNRNDDHQGSYDAGGYTARAATGDRPFSGGAGGYDYERGYGEGGRERHLVGYGSGVYGDGRHAYGGRAESRTDLEDRARDAGEFLRRTGERVRSWFNDMGHDHDYDRDRRGARGLGPKGYKRSDERISEEVHQRLTDDSWLDASNINVSVSGGEVTLSGTVDSREAKHRAERIVEDLSGVDHVQNNLRIQAGNYFTSAGRGYGDSVQEAQMRRDDPVKAVTDGETGPGLGASGATRDDAATRATTRRT